MPITFIPAGAPASISASQSSRALAVDPELVAELGRVAEPGHEDGTPAISTSSRNV